MKLIILILCTRSSFSMDINCYGYDSYWDIPKRPRHECYRQTVDGDLVEIEIDQLVVPDNNVKNINPLMKSEKSVKKLAAFASNVYRCLHLTNNCPYTLPFNIHRYVFKNKIQKKLLFRIAAINKANGNQFHILRSYGCVYGHNLPYVDIYEERFTGTLNTMDFIITNPESNKKITNNNQHPLYIRTSIQVAIMMVMGVFELHAKGYYHLNIEPKNFVVGQPASNDNDNCDDMMRKFINTAEKSNAERK